MCIYSAPIQPAPRRVHLLLPPGGAAAIMAKREEAEQRLGELPRALQREEIRCETRSANEHDNTPAIQVPSPLSLRLVRTGARPAACGLPSPTGANNPEAQAGCLSVRQFPIVKQRAVLRVR